MNFDADFTDEQLLRFLAPLPLGYVENLHVDGGQTSGAVAKGRAIPFAIHRASVAMGGSMRLHFAQVPTAPHLLHELREQGLVLGCKPAQLRGRAADRLPSAVSEKALGPAGP